MASLYDTYRMLSPEERDVLGDGSALDDDESIDDDAFSRHHRHKINATSITSTVIIRVTPRDDYLISWMILWAAFFFASLLAALQVYREQRTLRSRMAADIEHGGAEAVSSADRTRCTFRRLLLLAMVARLISMPVMIWSDPLWLQFVGDTLPEMIFATAWTLMVTFFVQLVASATGTVTNTDASLVIQGTAYIVYTCLIVLELFNSVASVLLYALLCCIYAALLGSTAYFCPKLLTLLQPSLVNYGTLITRLYACAAVCILVFAGHMVVFARVVIFSPQKVYWWINYGLLEWLPAATFLLLMNPTSSNKSDRNSPDLATDNESKKIAPQSTSTFGMKRSDSVGSASASSNNNKGSKHKRGASSTEASSLLKASPSYGSTSGDQN